jgi:hypothetical protein
VPTPRNILPILDSEQKHKLWSKILIQSENECWPWISYLYKIK